MITLWQRARYVVVTVLFLVILILVKPFGTKNGLIDDHRITISRPGEISARRKGLIRLIWGKDGFPIARLPSEVEVNIKSPIPDLHNLERTDCFKFQMEGGVAGSACHFIPARKNSQLVVVHQGHICTLNDSSASGNLDVGVARTIDGLLSNGFAVLGVYMPHQQPDDCRNDNHDLMFDDFHGTGSPIKYFLEPIVISLNYLKSEYHYEDISMLGISGGGWTTTVYAALDPTIRLSIPVAGSVPLYLRYAYNHDKEQFLPAFYRMAGYPDLYLLGSHGPGRAQIQILIRQDNCCFGESQHDVGQTGMSWDASVRVYESRVQDSLRKLGSGSFMVYIDETADRHMISDHVFLNVILPALEGEFIPSLYDPIE